MRRNLLAIPAAAIVMFSGALGMARPDGLAHAQKATDNYTGTVAFTDNVFPDSTIIGGAYGNSTTDGEVQDPLIDQLLGVDSKANFFPDLATEVPSTANGGIKTINNGTQEVLTLHLKENQKWSDGSPITPQDFISQLVLDFAPEYNQTLGVDQIKSMTYSGNDLIITYKGLYAAALSYGIPNILPFEYFLKKYKVSVPASLMSSYDADKVAAMYAGASYKGSALQKLVTAWVNDPYASPNDIFDGPYKIAEWTDQQRVTEVPNPYYTALPADKAHPRLAKIQFVVITLSGTAYPLAMQAGSTYNNVDLAEDFRLADLPTLQKSQYQVVIRPALNAHQLVLNLQVPALRDIRVRQALLFAIDKTAYIQSLFRGVDAKLASQLSLNAILPSVSPYSYNNSLPVNPYDPAKARALLAAAGYATSTSGSGNHLVLTYTAFGNSVNIRSSLILQHMWAQVGIQVKMIYVPSSGPNGLLSSYQDGGVIYRRTFQIIEYGLQGSVDPDNTLGNIDPTQIPDATHPTGGNSGGVNDATVVDLFQKARHTLDDAQRHKFYNQAQLRFYQQAYWIMLYNLPNISLYKGTIGNYKPNPTQSLNEWNSFEWFHTTKAAPEA